jgi:hypothetical protein
MVTFVAAIENPGAAFAGSPASRLEIANPANTKRVLNLIAASFD